MKRYCLSALLTFYFTFATNVPAKNLKVGVFQESLLVDTFEKGRSLVIAKIDSVHKEKDTKFYAYKVEIVRTIIPGDLTEDDTYGLLNLFAGASYGNALTPGRAYALFMTKDCPFYYSWANRDDKLQVNLSNKRQVQTLVRAANAAYAKTVIRRFRQRNINERAKLPPLPSDIISLCEEFRHNPPKRAKIGKQLYESDLSSRLDESKPFSSTISYLPPKIPLTRSQIVTLLGKPNLKSGWTYSWLIGQIGKGFGAKKVNVLSATFDKNEIAILVVYWQGEKSEWTKLTAYNIDSYLDLCGWADPALQKFRRSLINEDWDTALSCCSKTVRARAEEYDSAQAFFKEVVPIRQVTELSEFRARGYSGRAGRIVRLRVDGPWLDVPDEQISGEWEWSLTRYGDRWFLDFETLPLDMLIKKKTLLPKLLKEAAETRRTKFDRGIEYKLIPLSEDFAVGRPMLFRINMVNVSDLSVLFMDTRSVMVNDPMAVIGPNGEDIKYVDTSYQIAVGHEVILPGETITLADNYDVTSQYGIVKPGRYTFQFKGASGRNNKRSNTFEVEVKEGELSAADSVFASILSVLPKGWTATRRLAPTKLFSGDRADTFINVHLIGKRTGKLINVDISLAIAKDVSSLDHQYVNKLQVWGKCRWGHVYARVRDAELLWPDYREQIVKALEIE